MPLRFKKRVLAHLSDERYEPATLDALADLIGVDDEDWPEFSAAVDQMRSEGTIAFNSRDQITLPAIDNEITGRIKVHPKGFAFIIPDIPNREGDLFVPAGETGGAVTNDRVRARVVRDRSPRRQRSSEMSPFTGRVIEIIERGKTNFVGTLRREGSAWLVDIDGKSIREPIRIRDVGAKDAKSGDKVHIEIVHFPDHDSWGEGVILKRLGPAGEPDVETQAVIHSYDLPEDEFSDAVMQQARKIADEFEFIDDEIANREDLREEFIFTIDPPDAHDFDDAISIRRFNQKNAPSPGVAWELGIHIADVGHFIGADTPMDVDARERGNSVYLPRHVIPMLPEMLSNGICSLQEGVDRLTKTAFIRYDDAAKVVSTRFAATIIRSNKRLTYLEAEALLKDDERDARAHAAVDTPYPDGLVEHLKMMDELARRIRNRRHKDGMIVLTLPDVEFAYDDDGRIADVEPEDDASTHGLIEMFMVEANEAVASLFERLRVPILRRTHPDPSTFDVRELRRFCRIAGIEIPADPSRLELQWILEATRDKPAQHAIHLAVLKSLTRAEYSPAIIGHFALASEHYAHFTSPIRRYPDLLVHRALAAYLEKTNGGRKMPKGKGAQNLGKALRKDDRCLDEPTLVEIGRHCSDTERNAEAAERSLREFLVLQFLADKHMGDEFDGTVVNIASKAIWIQLDRVLAEGMVGVRDIPIGDDDESNGKSSKKKKRDQRPPRWRLNSDMGILVADGSGATVKMGDRYRVQIVAVDPAARQLDLRIIARKKSKERKESKSQSSEKHGGKKSRSSFKDRKSAKRSSKPSRGKKDKRNSRGKRHGRR